MYSSGVSYRELDAVRSMNDDECALFMCDLEIYHQVFVNGVAINRSLTLEKVQEYADGS